MDAEIRKVKYDIKLKDTEIGKGKEIVEELKKKIDELKRNVKKADE